MDNSNEINQQLYEWILENEKDQVIEILRESDPTAAYSFNISMADLPSNVITELHNKPNVVFPSFHEALNRVMSEAVDARGDGHGLRMKKKVHVRVYGLFEGTNAVRSVFPKNATDANKFFAITGTVVRTTTVKLLRIKQPYECVKCKEITEVKAIRHRSFVLPKPSCCSKCGSSKFILIKTEPTPDQISDYQEVKLQQKDSSGYQAANRKTILVALEHDLCGKLKPGDDCLISGTLYVRWGTFTPDAPIIAELVFRGNHITVCNESRTTHQDLEEASRFATQFWEKYAANPFMGRDVIFQSFCPDLHGLYLVKASVAVVLAGGVVRMKGAERTRGQSHLLLIGDPGTAKSKVLKYITQITSRSVYTNGACSSNAGLTVAAVKEAGDSAWSLEAGSLVLANNGVCLIDEFSLIREADKTVIYEALEQQTVSVAKAGLFCTLNAACTVVAATNPKILHYDETKSFEENVGLPSPLLSRFDVILTLRNTTAGPWDEMLARFLLNNESGPPTSENERWTTAQIKQYLNYVKNLQPTMTEDAYAVISGYFGRQREHPPDSRRTIRLVESICRLSEGHAKIMNSEQVRVMDAVFAVALIDVTMPTYSLWPKPEVTHVTAPADSMQNYYDTMTTVLTTLGLYDILEREKDFIDALKIATSSQ